MRSTLLRRAFTLVELLVVVSILVIVLTLAVPAFSSMLRSSERSLAENQFRAGIAAGRDAAIQSESGDGAAVFFFEPGGRLSIVPCVHVATIRDRLTDVDPLTGEDATERDLFVPVANSEPLQLPTGWTVRGYAQAHTFDQDGSDPNGWYDGPMWAGRAKVGNWVFPETGFYDHDAGDKGRSRQTFMVRFKKGTGEVEVADRRTCLVVDVSPDDNFRNQPPWDGVRLDRTENLALSVRRLAALINDGVGTLDAESRLLGDIATDTVLTRPVTELALCEEKQLAKALGARGLNRVTASLYDNDATDPRLPAKQPVLDRELFTGNLQDDDIVDMINRWIEGRLEMNGEIVESDARVFTFQYYAGQVEEIAP